MNRLFALLLGALLISSAPVRAQETPALFDLSLGVFDMMDDGSAVEGRVEWRGKPMLWWLRPMLGVSVTSDAATYSYAGLAFELWWANRRIVLTPSAAFGAYIKGGDGKDLGHVLEFRTGAALQYRFDDESRLGISFHHVSNAGLGKNKKNPGEESLMLSYAIPVSRIFK